MKSSKLIKGLVYAAIEAQRYSVHEMLEHRQGQSLPAKLAKVAVGKGLSVALPRELQLGRNDYEFIAQGCDHLVYASQDEVAKIVYRSVTLDRNASAASAAEFQRQHSELAAHLGGFEVDTEYSFRRFKAGLYATVALQPRLYPDLKFFDVTQMIDHRRDDYYLDMLGRFSEALRNYYESTGMQVDLNGEENLFLLDDDLRPQLKVVDTMPVTPQAQQGYMSARGQKTGEVLLGMMGQIETAAQATLKQNGFREVAAR